LQGRLTLLLGPPGSGKSTLLKALAGKLGGKSPRITGSITYNGETFSSFVPQRTAAYVSQVRLLASLCLPSFPFFRTSACKAFLEDFHLDLGDET